MTWLHNGIEIDESTLENYVGFVYIIHNTLTNKRYIGKKLLKFSKTKTIKGKKKRIKVDSDWKTYYGSNTYLQEEVKTLGEQHFRREIIRLCKSKGECNYYELREQMMNDVLLKPNEFYNSFVGGKIHRSHILKKE